MKGKMTGYALMAIIALATGSTIEQLGRAWSAAPAMETETLDSQAWSSLDQAEPPGGPGAEDPVPLNIQQTGIFVPSETIEADRAVAFPVDI